MKAWAEFYPYTLPELPGVPAPMLDHGLRQAATDFCERSKVYVQRLAAVSAVAGQMAYTLTLPEDTELVEVVEVLYKGKPLEPEAPEYLAGQYGDWRAKTGQPHHYLHRGSDELLLVPAPAEDASSSIVVDAALKPSSTAPGIDDWVFSRWRDAIATGAKARLMTMAGRPWSRPDLAPFYDAMFAAAIRQAAAAANSGFVRHRPRARGIFV